MARYQAVTLAYLLNKKIIFILLFILIVFTGWFFVSAEKNKQKEYIANKEGDTLSVVADKTSQYDADTDGDGLKDWEEALWKTDINKADTDSDGTNDKEEIASGRDPLKAGPNDKVSDKEDLVAQEKALADSKQNTMTAIYARKFMKEYLTLKTQKGDLTKEDKQNLVVKTMNDIKPLETVDKYKISDLNVIKDISKESVKQYADLMIAVFIITKMPEASELDIFTALLEGIKKEDFKSVEASKKALKQYVVLNQRILEAILPPSIPENLSKLHLEVVNGFNNISLAVEDMTGAENDPIKAMIGQRIYTEQKLRIYNAMKSIQEVFNKYEITVFK